MPEFKDVKVMVMDLDDQPLKEYGIHKHERTGLITCFIQSKNDMRFQIGIVPTLPFPVHAKDSDDSDAAMSEDDFDAGKPKTKRKKKAKLRNTVLPREGMDFPLAPWHLLATLRLDGRRMPEKRAIVYLDDSQPTFDKTHGEIVMKSRFIHDRFGRLMEVGWLFKELGIESVKFDDLKLRGDEDKDGEVTIKKEDDELDYAFGNLGTKLDDQEDQEPASSIGQIEVTFQRVTLGVTTKEYWKSERGDTFRLDSGTSPTTGVSHSVARDARVVEHPKKVNYIEYSPVVPCEQPYATFRFYYRSEEKLRKYGFPGLSAKIQTRKQTGKEAISQAAAAPLSINQKRMKYSLDETGEVVGEEKGAPVASMVKPKEGTIEGETALKPWTPQQNVPRIELSGKDMSKDAPSSPSYAPASGHESGDTATLSPSCKDLLAANRTPAPEADQSSADESAPSRQTIEKPKSELMKKFRMLDPETMDDDADDEASDGGRTPNSMSFRDDNGDAVGDEGNDVSRDEPDQGIGERLNKVQIGSKRASSDEEKEEVGSETAEATSKKAKVEPPA